VRTLSRRLNWSSLLLPILLLAAAVRLLGLGNQNLWGDEAFSVMTALGPIRSLLGQLSTGEPHPPLYPVLLAVWLRAFGHSEFVARLPSAIAGIAAVPVTAAIARRFAPDDDERAATRLALIAALLVAINPFQVWYSQEARMYAQVSFFAGLATLGLLRLWEGRRWSIPLYVIGLIGAMGSHYYGLFIPLAHAIALGIELLRDRGVWPRVRLWIVASAVAGVIYLPWVIYAQRIFRSYYGARPGTVDLAQIALQSWVRISAGWSLGWVHAELAAAALTVLVLLGLIAPARSSSDRFTRAVVACWLFTPFVVGYLVSLVRPLYAERYLIVSSLPIILFVARGLAWPRPVQVGKLVTGFGLVAALALALGPLYNVWQGAYLKSTYDTHVRIVQAYFRPGDSVILDGTSQLPLYDYYLPAPWPTYPLPRTLPLSLNQVTTDLRKIAADHSGAWIFLYATQDYDPGYEIPRWLTANAYRTYDNWAVSGRLQYYHFASDASLTRREVAMRFGDSLALEQYGVTIAPLTAGDTIAVDLKWQQLATRINRPRVALRMMGSDGFIWAQTDQYVGGDFASPLPWQASRVLDDRHGLLVPPGTPLGAYRLILNVYPEGGNSLPITGTGAPIDPSGIVLGTIRVTKAAASFSPVVLAGFQSRPATFSDGLRLLGFAGGQSATAGSSGYLTLVWQASRSNPGGDRLHISLVASDGREAEARDIPLSSGYPPSQWTVGDIIRGQYNLPVSDRLAAGTYTLKVRPSDASGDGVTLDKLVVQAGPTPVPVPRPQHALAYQLGSAIALSGYDVTNTTLKPGQTLHLTLYWHDVAPVDRDYKVFVHVLNGAQKVVAQQDQIPAAGTRPTSSWFPGDDIADQYQIPLPTDLPAGSYPIEIGVYDPNTGTRLAVSQNGSTVGDRIILTKLEVAP